MALVDCVAIVSGGMDSVTLLHYLVKQQKRNPAIIVFNYGQKHYREVDCAKENADQLGCINTLIDLSPLQFLFSISALVSDEITIPNIDTVTGDPQPITYVPNRNMIFLSLAAAYAETLNVNEIYYGAQSHDLYGYWDTTPDFVMRLNSVLALNRKSTVSVIAPFVSYSKTDVLRLGLAMNVDYSKTWSCYAGQELACGKCPTCAERLKAFEAVGISDPLPYSVE